VSLTRWMQRATPADAGCGYATLAIDSSEWRDLALDIAAAGGRLVPGDLALDEVAALLAACAAAVGNDSGLTHLAAAAACPTVALFGPTDPARTAPVGGATILRSPAGHPLADLHADEVAAAVLRLVV